MLRNLLVFFLLYCLTGCIRTPKVASGNAVSSNTNTLIVPSMVPYIHNPVSVSAEIQEYIHEPISREKAVHIALLNNKSLQAQYENLGIAKTDLIQAGLLQNPGLAGVFCLPVGQIDSVMIAEVVALFSISDLWQVPLRKDIAQKDLEMASLNMLNTMLKTVLETRQAYDTLLFKYESKRILEQYITDVKKTRSAFLQQKNKLSQYELEQHVSDIEYEHIKLQLASMKDDITIAQAALARLLGLPVRYSRKIKCADTFQNITIDLPSFKILRSWAYANKPDFQLALYKIQRYEAQVRYEKLLLFKDVSFGIAYQSQALSTNDVISEPFVGPAFDMKVPLFDKNQAQIARAKHQLEMAKKELEAQKVTLEHDIYQAYNAVHGYKEQMNLYDSILKKLRKKNQKLTKRSYQSQKYNPHIIRQSQKSLYDIQVKMLDDRLAILQAISDIEYTIGRRIDLSDEHLAEAYPKK